MWLGSVPPPASVCSREVGRPSQVPENMTVTDSLASFPDFFQIAKENEVVVWWGRGQVGTAALPVVAFRGSAREREALLYVHTQARRSWSSARQPLAKVEASQDAKRTRVVSPSSCCERRVGTARLREPRLAHQLSSCRRNHPRCCQVREGTRDSCSYTHVRMRMRPFLPGTTINASLSF